MTNPNPHKNIPLDQGSTGFGLEKIEVLVDLSLSENKTTSAVASGVFIPAYCDVVDVIFFVEDAVTSAGSLTFAMGTDSTSDPDNFLNDLAITSIDADNDKVDGIPRLGTDATKIAHTAATEIYWKCGTAAPTGGRIKTSILVRKYA